MDKKTRVKRYISLFIGLLLYSVSFNLFILPNGLVCGGFTGISVITQKLFGWEPSMFILTSAFGLLALSFLTLGKEKTLGSVLGSILYPLAVKVTVDICSLIPFDSSQILLSSLFAGVLNGIATGLIFKAGFTTGGTDILKQIFSKYKGRSTGTAILLIDGSVVIAGAFVFGITKLMYALVVLYIVSILTDKVMLGISESKAFYIVTSKEEQVKNYVLETLGRGVTIFESKGGYERKNQKVLFCVIPTKEYTKLSEEIENMDQSAFLVVTDAYQVYGGE